MFRRFFPLLACVFIGTVCSVGGWWLGFRDGATRAFADTGLILSRYHQATKEGQAERAHAALEGLSAQTAVHLLNGRHHWPLVHENPYRAESALAELRAAWTPEPRAFTLGTSIALRYPYEPAAPADYARLFEAVVPVAPERQLSRRP